LRTVDMTASGSTASGSTALRPLQEQIEQANASGRTPVVLIHGLWLLASSWDRWAEHFAQAGYAPVSPGWPDDPDTVEEAIADPRPSPTRPSARWPITTRASSASSAASRP
jgi:hypothetical protein